MTPDDIFEKTNPPVLIYQFTHHGDNFTIIDDGVLVGGTKQRLLGEIVGMVDASEIIYAGPSIGIAQLALAYTATLWGKKATIFLNTHNSDLDEYTKRAIRYGAKIFFARSISGRTLAETQKASKKYVDKDKRRLLLPFGIKAAQGELYFEVFRKALISALPLNFPPPKRLWLVAGSGFLFDVLHSIFPTTKFMIVQVGRKIWPDQLDGIKSELFVAPETFYETAKYQPPYKTVPNYDAKLWQFVLKHGKDGDFIWNVASK
jgi:hypothetical protein